MTIRDSPGTQEEAVDFNLLVLAFYNHVPRSTVQQVLHVRLQRLD